jgi:hypothetical protein
MTPRTRRRAAVVALAVVIAAGLAVHALPGSAATDVAGDALYAIAAYSLVVAVAPGLHPLVVGAFALVWCIAVELLQLSPVPLAVASVLPPARLVLGSGFDPRDLVVYGVAALFAGIADAAARRISPVGRSRPAARRPR